MNARIICEYCVALKKIILILALVVTIVIIGWGQSSIRNGSQVTTYWIWLKFDLHNMNARIICEYFVALKK